MLLSMWVWQSCVFDCISIAMLKKRQFVCVRPLYSSFLFKGHLKQEITIHKLNNGIRPVILFCANIKYCRALTDVISSTSHNMSYKSTMPIWVVLKLSSFCNIWIMCAIRWTIPVYVGKNRCIPGRNTVNCILKIWHYTVLINHWNVLCCEDKYSHRNFLQNLAISQFFPKNKV